MKKRISLKWLLTSIIICCWVLPITLVLGSMSYYSNLRISEGLSSDLETSAQTAIDSTINNLEYVIEASKAASYDGIIEAAYKKYVEDSNVITLHNTTTDYLKSNYQKVEYIISTMLVYNETPDNVYYTNYFKDSQGNRDVIDFWSQYGEEVWRICDELGTSNIYFVKDEKVYLIRNLVTSQYQPYAVIIFELNGDEIFNDIEMLTWIDSARITMDGNVISLYESVLEEGEDTIEERNLFEYDYSKVVSNHTYEYEIDLDTSLITASYMEMNRIVMLLIVCVLPLIALVIYFFYFHFTKPIRLMINASKSLEAGDVGYQIKEQAPNVELEYLVEQFNSMSQSMKQQMEQIYEEQVALQAAKIKALQSQINPHFLNNTIEVISWEIRLGENERASEMIDALATMLNATMARNEMTTTHLKEEMMYVDSYLTIMSTRMGKRLTIIREIDESAMDYEVPLLILQPIIENAIEHGIAMKIEGVLILRVYQTEDEVVVEIENDNPLSAEDKARIDVLLRWDGKADKEHIGYSSLGIRNVNQRLKLIFGEKHGLTIEGMDNGNTMSQIRFPKVQKETS